MSQMWFDKFPHINLTNKENNIGDGSSSLVRKILGQQDIDKNIIDILDNDVLDYIIKNRLYIEHTETISV